MMRRAATLVTLLATIFIALSLAVTALRSHGAADEGLQPNSNSQGSAHPAAESQPSEFPLTSAQNSRPPASQDLSADGTSILNGAQSTLLCPSNSDRESPAGLLTKSETQTNYAEILMNWDWHSWREPKNEY